jgi:hypothetical protein
MRLYSPYGLRGDGAKHKCIVKENKSTYVLNMNRCPVTLEVELFRNGWVWKGRRPQKGASENGRAREMN